MSFSVSEEAVDERTQVIAVSGELDSGAHPFLTARVGRAIGAGKTRLVIDLAQATFLDSTGLSALLGYARRFRSPGAAFAVVVAPASQPFGRFEISHTRDLLTVCDSREEALALVGRPPEMRVPNPHRAVQLRLYVDGGTPSAHAAIAALAQLRRRLGDGVVADVIDVNSDLALGDAGHLFATPALVRVAPPPMRRVVGDLSDEERVLWALDLAS
jgi:circadian clock protein KaiB